MKLLVESPNGLRARLPSFLKLSDGKKIRLKSLLLALVALKSVWQISYTVSGNKKLPLSQNQNQLFRMPGCPRSMAFITSWFFAILVHRLMHCLTNSLCSPCFAVIARCSRCADFSTLLSLQIAETSNPFTAYARKSCKYSWWRRPALRATKTSEFTKRTRTKSCLPGSKNSSWANV